MPREFLALWQLVPGVQPTLIQVIERVSGLGNRASLRTITPDLLIPAILWTRPDLVDTYRGEAFGGDVAEVRT